MSEQVFANMPDNCPINEQTADGVSVGRCWHKLENYVCPRHGEVREESDRFRLTGHTTIENMMRQRKGMPLLGPKRKPTLGS